MSDSYYPRHSRDHLDVLRDWPMPTHDVPRLTREVEGLRTERDRLLEALKTALECTGYVRHSSLCFSGSPYEGCTCEGWVKQARAAIESVRP